MVKAERNHLKPPNAVKVKDKPNPESRTHRTVDVMGEKTWAERDAELRNEAVDCDSETESQSGLGARAT